MTMVALALVAAGAPATAGAVSLPSTDGGVHLWANVHVYRLLPNASSRYLPDEATAASWARSHDLAVGEWRSGSTSLPAAGLLTYPSGTPAEPALVAANPALVLALYFNGTKIESGFRPPYFPADWYATTAPDQYGLYVANTATTTPFTAAAFGFTAAGWAEWVGKYDAWMLANAPQAAYHGAYLDEMHLDGTPTATSNRIADTWRASNPGMLLITNSLRDGKTYFAGASATLGHPDVANMEYFLNTPAKSGAVWPTKTRWAADVSALIDAQNRGQDVTTMTKLWDNRLSQAQVRQWRELAVASYLIADRGRLWMELSAFGGVNAWSWPDATIPWQAQWRWYAETPADHEVYGAPVGPSSDPADVKADGNHTANAALAYQHGAILSRRFQHGLAIVNPTTTDQTVSLDSRHYTYARNGQSVTSPRVTLPAHSGLVLLTTDAVGGR